MTLFGGTITAVCGGRTLPDWGHFSAGVNYQQTPVPQEDERSCTAGLKVSLDEARAFRVLIRSCNTSGKPDEIYRRAGFDLSGPREKLLACIR